MQPHLGNIAGFVQDAETNYATLSTIEDTARLSLARINVFAFLQYVGLRLLQNLPTTISTHFHPSMPQVIVQSAF